jgi:anti-sigma-K factor RskA
VWQEPSPELEDRVVAAIERARAVEEPSTGNVHAIPAPRRPARTRWRSIAAVAAAAAVLVGTVAVLTRDDGADAPRFEVALTATDLAPAAEGRATLSRTDAGWRIELDASGLDRLADGRFYQAWLIDDDGVGVPIGTFNTGERVTLWAGVSPLDFRDLSITEESADGDQTSSGRRVLTGTITD